MSKKGLNKVTVETVMGAMREDSEAINKYYKKASKDHNAFQDSTHAIRYDQDKPHMDLLSPIAMFGTAQVLTKGLEKYPNSQWKKGLAWSRVIASLLRHTFKFMSGEDIDQESLCPHVDHIAANAMFLQEFYRTHKDKDDRIKTGLE